MGIPSMEEIFGPEGIMMKGFPAFEHREEQLELAESVAGALASEGGYTLAAEAPPGVGKTFALLAPAMLRASASGETVLFLTASIPLQEQLIMKDRPRLNELLGLDLPFGLLKGNLLQRITVTSATDGIPSGWCGRAMLSLLNKSGLGKGLKPGNGDAWPSHPRRRMRAPKRCSTAALAGAEVARTLSISIGASILIIRRVLKFADEPVVLDEIYLPGDLFPELSLEMLNAAGMSLYSLFETRYGVRMLRADERLRAVCADKLSADILQVAEGDPLLLVERVAYTYANKPVEWRRGLYLTNNFHYHNEL